MAIFSASIRNVRNGMVAGGAPTAGSGQTPNTNVIHAHVNPAHTSTTPLSDADALALAKNVISALNVATPTDSIETAFATALKAAHASNTTRAAVGTGVYSFRIGKALYQFGVAYHASVPATAYGATVWHNLS
jgi:hypothetical protein